MNVRAVLIDAMIKKGKWVEAKLLFPTPTTFEKVKCFFGFHRWQESQKYQDTQICFCCGLRQLIVNVILEDDK